MATAKVIEDSISTTGQRVTTLQLEYPRLVHAELMTHRTFSRNASSSRAIPVAKMIDQVRNNPATPVHWSKNQPGMQAREEVEEKDVARTLWIKAANDAADHAERMMKLGLHKQVANRILEPFQFIHVVVTATEWDNFFELRDHADADPNIRALAVAMREAMRYHQPRLLDFQQWHLPYIKREERGMPIENLLRMSSARCARVSYLKHDGGSPSIEDDFALYDRLVGSNPIHASPTEHQATPDPMGVDRAHWGNFQGWVQHRKIVEDRFGNV